MARESETPKGEISLEIHLEFKLFFRLHYTNKVEMLKRFIRCCWSCILYIWEISWNVEKLPRKLSLCWALPLVVIAKQQLWLYIWGYKDLSKSLWISRRLACFRGRITNSAFNLPKPKPLVSRISNSLKFQARKKRFSVLFSRKEIKNCFRWWRQNSEQSEVSNANALWEVQTEALWKTTRQK